MDYFAAIRLAIRRDHKCIALHSQTVAVKAVVEDKVLWEGNVEIYDLIAHPEARRCYAWGLPAGRSEGWEITTALEISPVLSPECAVKAALAGRTGRKPA